MVSDVREVSGSGVNVSNFCNVSVGGNGDIVGVFCVACVYECVGLRVLNVVVGSLSLVPIYSSDGVLFRPKAFFTSQLVSISDLVDNFDP